MSKKVQKKFVMGLNVWWSWGSGFFFNFFWFLAGLGALFGTFFVIFSCKTSGFCGGGCSFWYLFCHFFVIFPCTISGLCGGGWSFWVKKYFFSCKTSVFAGMGGLFGTFCVIFLCKTSGFCGAGWSFWVKNDTFFHAKHQLLRGWVVFLVPFLSFFCHFS